MSLDFTIICRTCLALEGAVLSIYDSKGSSGGHGCVADMIADLTNIPPNKEDGMPEKVCLTCISEINRCYSFKIKCDNSDRTLRQLLNIADEPTEVQEEPKFKPLVSNPVENRDEKKKPLKQKTETSFRVLNQDSVQVQGESNEIYSVRAVEELESSYFVISTDVEDNEGNDEKQDAQEDGNSVEYDDILRKYVHQSREDDDEEMNEELAESESFKERGIRMKKEEQKCPMCPMKFVHPRNLSKHIHKHHISRDLSADQHEQKLDNFKEGDSEQEDNQQIDEHDGFELEFQSIEDPEDPNLIEERSLQKDEVDTQMQERRCPRCGAGFAQQKSLNIHVKQNKCTEKQYSCGKCQKVFISKENLRVHIRAHKEEITCCLCGDIFRDKEALHEHKAEKHNAKAKNQCPHCKKVFTMLSTLKDHMRIHSGERPFLCSICGKGFSQNANLKQHVMRHNKTKPYKCEQCPRSFVSKGELYSHVRSHTGDHPFACNVCKTAFTTSSSLVKHRRIHTGERPYACEFCPMRFTALNTLKNHRRTHTGEKPYKCKYCQRGFAQNSDCAIHMRTHTGERRYICQICGSAFQQSGTLRSHMKTHRDRKDEILKGEDAEQSPSVEELVDDEESKKPTASVHVGAEMGEDELVHFAIEECSSENNDFSGE